MSEEGNTRRKCIVIIVIGGFCPPVLTTDIRCVIGSCGI